MRTWRSTRRLGTPPRESLTQTRKSRTKSHYEHQPGFSAQPHITSAEDTSRTSCGCEPGGRHAGLELRRAKANTNLERQQHTTLRTSTRIQCPTTHHFCRGYFENQLWMRTWRSTRRLGTPPRESLTQTRKSKTKSRYEHQPRRGAREHITSAEDTSKTSCGCEPGGRHAGLAHRHAKANTNPARQHHATLRTSPPNRYPKGTSLLQKILREPAVDANLAVDAKARHSAARKLMR